MNVYSEVQILFFLSEASLVAQMVKNLPAVQETPVRSRARKIH